MLERNMILRTASRWHVLGIGDAQDKDPFETAMTHVVTAAQPGRLGDGDIGEASQTLNPTESVSIVADKIVN